MAPLSTQPETGVLPLFPDLPSYWALPWLNLVVTYLRSIECFQRPDFTHINSIHRTILQNRCYDIIPIWQMQNLKHRKVKWLTHPRLYERQTWDTNWGNPVSISMLTTPMPYCFYCNTFHILLFASSLPLDCVFFEVRDSDLVCSSIFSG